MLESKPIIESLVASVIFTFVQLLITQLNGKLSGSSISAIKTLSFLLAGYIIICTSILFYFEIDDLKTTISLYSIPIIVYISYILLFLFRLSATGIVNINKKASKGFDYKKALRSVDNSFYFLGTGASKLTNVPDEEFVKMISRIVKNGGVIKLLLCDPEAAALSIMEKRARVSEGEFKSRVKQSLQLILDNKKIYEEINIRFYNSEDIDHMPPFRLMFINGEICLTSFTIIGDKNRGENFPQIHYKKIFNRDAASPTFYAPFEKYFNTLWNDSKEITSDKLAEVVARL